MEGIPPGGFVREINISVAYRRAQTFSSYLFLGCLPKLFLEAFTDLPGIGPFSLSQLFISPLKQPKQTHCHSLP